MKDTIFAFATPEGRSAISVLRISGPRCDVAITKMLNRRPVSRQATLVKVYHPRSGEILDEAIAIFFPGPKSFSGEDCLELHLHGSRAVREAVLKALSELPEFSPAEPGEFTRRAFLNGKTDLLKVEALGDLLEAETEEQRRHATRQMDGTASAKCYEWRENLVQAIALLEASIDFADEGDAPVEVLGEIRQTVERLSGEISAILDNSRSHEIVREGYSVVIAGPPNSGKSSLINALAHRDVAIVTEFAGTTRDVLEVSIDLDGYLVRVFDTAGLRETTDFIEQIGVGKTKLTLRTADLVLWLRECGKADFSAEADRGLGKSELLINTKADLCNGRASHHENDFWISTKTGEGIDRLLQCVRLQLMSSLPGNAGVLFARARQLDCLRNCASALDRTTLVLPCGEAELIVEELRVAADALASLVGQINPEDVLGEIFSRFCMGK